GECLPGRLDDQDLHGGGGLAGRADHVRDEDQVRG
ncbi:MAG: hypothetical protein AVDCRST_MAG88-2227, partial [uncultured Thermomicrobiales bacterium]